MASLRHHILDCLKIYSILHRQPSLPIVRTLDLAQLFCYPSLDGTTSIASTRGGNLSGSKHAQHGDANDRVKKLWGVLFLIHSLVLQI